MNAYYQGRARDAVGSSNLQTATNPGRKSNSITYVHAAQRTQGHGHAGARATDKTLPPSPPPTHTFAPLPTHLASFSTIFLFTKSVIVLATSGSVYSLTHEVLMEEMRLTYTERNTGLYYTV